MQGHKTSGRKAKALHKTRNIKVTRNQASGKRDKRGLITRGEGKLSEDTKKNRILCFCALAFSQRTVLS